MYSAHPINFPNIYPVDRTNKLSDIDLQYCIALIGSEGQRQLAGSSPPTRPPVESAHPMKKSFPRYCPPAKAPAVSSHIERLQSGLSWQRGHHEHQLTNQDGYIFYAGGSLAGAGYCRQCRRRPAILLLQLWQGCQVRVKISAQRPPRVAQFNARWVHIGLLALSGLK